MLDYARPTVERNQLETLFRDITACFTRRPESLTALTGALLTYPGPVDCVAHLSLATPGYTHWGLYEALKHGLIDETRLTSVLVGAALDDDWFENIYSIDATSWHLPESYSTPDRVMAYSPRAFRYGGPVAIPGFKYQAVAAQAHGTGSWGLPVSILRVEPGMDVNLLAFDQMKEVMQSAPDDAVFVFDSGYSSHYLTHLTRRAGLPCEILMRLEKNRVFYGEPENPVARGGRGGVSWRHGDRFELNNPSKEPEYSVCFQDHKYGRVTVEAYTGLHSKLFHQHAGMKQVLEEEGELPVIPGTVLHVTSSMNADMWLWYSGDPKLMNLRDLFYSYAHRYDIEHMFRFMKQTLGFTSFHPGGTHQADNWAWLQACVLGLLAVGRRIITDIPNRWEKTVTRIKVTAGRVRRVISQHVSHIVSLLGVAIKKTHGLGATPKALGGVRTKRKQYPVHVVGRPHHTSLRPDRAKQEELRRRKRLEKALQQKGLPPPKI